MACEKVVCDKVVEAAEREEEEKEERDTESKTRTPHKDVGEKQHHMKHKKTIQQRS